MLKKDKSMLELLDTDNIPLALCKPDDVNNRNMPAIWLPYLGGAREMVTPHLKKLADNGFMTG